MRKLLTQERFTVLASATVAIAILGAAVTAQPSRTSPSDRLERLESDLRYQLELESRVNAPLYAARTKTLDGVLDAWRRSPQSAGDYQLLMGWLKQSLSRSLPGDGSEWPAAPQFAAEPAVEHVARKEAAEDQGTTAVVERPKSPPEVSQTRPAATPASKAQAAVDVARKAAGPSVPVANSASQVAKAKAAPKEKAEPAKPFIVHISDPVPLGSEPLTVKNPAPPTPVFADAAPVETTPPIAEVQRRPAPTAVQTAKVYQEPSTGESSAPPAAESAPATKPAPVKVNLAELNARVGGYHDGLRDVEAACVAGREGMTLGQVLKLVERLEALAAQQQFVRLYYESLTPGEREFVTAPRSMAGTIVLVDQQRSRVEEAGDADHFSAADEAGGGELSRRLQALAEAAGE